MKPMPDQALERLRQVHLDLQQTGGSGAGTADGMFVVRFKGATLRIISSIGDGWEHVSVSLEHRTPTWTEMCFVKDLFWGEEEEVIQFHPARSQYVNHHPYCLHLWKPLNFSIALPPPELVGPR
jgi:hypothetical protein